MNLFGNYQVLYIKYTLNNMSDFSSGGQEADSEELYLEMPVCPLDRLLLISEREPQKTAS